MEIENNLKRYIQDKGIKQNAVAKAIGVSAQTFNQILKGHRRIYGVEFMKACDFMNVTAETIANYDPRKKVANL